MPIYATFVPGLAPVAALAAAGVARVSLGCALFLASLSLVQVAASELLSSGTYGALTSAITVSHKQGERTVRWGAGSVRAGNASGRVSSYRRARLVRSA